MSLSRSEIELIVARYIGVSGGYLGDFTYDSHESFYPTYCGIDDINTYEYTGTTQSKFKQILEEQSEERQARILRGLLDRFPVADPESVRARFLPVLQGHIQLLESAEGPFQWMTLNSKDDFVLRALKEADALLRSTGPASAIDRVHTALHAHVVGLCTRNEIIPDESLSLTSAFKALRKANLLAPATGVRAEEVNKVLQSLASGIDSLNNIRNNASSAHPTQEVLDQADARFVVQAARALLNYLDAKFPVL